MQKKPDFLDKVVNVWFFTWAPYIHHPLVCRLVTPLTLVNWDVPVCKTFTLCKICIYPLLHLMTTPSKLKKILLKIMHNS